MKILLTGVAGFIGSHLARRLLERGDSVVGIDSLNDYYDPALKTDRLALLKPFPAFSFLKLDLDESGRLRELVVDGSFDRVVNLAAQAGVRYSIQNPAAYAQSNLTGFLNVLEACRAARTPHLVYASSSSVYGLNNTRPFTTHGPANHPSSLYAATKKANELMAHAYSHLYALSTTGLRFFTVYGPWGRPDMAYFKFAQAILDGRPIDVYNKGNMVRDFTYIADVVEGVVRAMDRPPSGDPLWDAAKPDPASSSAPYRLYNIGNNAPVRLDAFIDTIERLMGRKAVRNYLPMQPGDVYATEADVADLERDFGWKPTTGIEDGLARFAEWFLSYRRGTS